MSDDPPPRRPIKVVLMVAIFWIGGSIMQSGFGWLLASSGMIGADSAATVGLILGWGLLFLASLYFRDQLDTWLRT